MESKPPAPIEAIIAGLRSGEATRAWRTFLEVYAARIQQIVRHHVRDEDGRADCFLFVCERLAEDGCRRLTRFDPTGRAQFPTWLTVVVTRLVIDWLRQWRGRERPFANIARLSALEQRVFHHRYERQRTREETVRTLRGEFADFDETRIDAAIARIESVLTPDQRWRLSVRGATETSLDDASDVADGASLEDGTAEREAFTRLGAALSKLPDRDRLLLLLRFEQDLTLDQIATQLGLGDPFRARRAIEAALARLRALFGATD